MPIFGELVTEQGIDNCHIVLYEDATAHLAQREQCQVVLRGLRGERDWPWEAGVATVHATMDLETIYLGTDPRWSNLSSSLVREAHRAGLPLDTFVPPAVATAISRR